MFPTTMCCCIMLPEGSRIIKNKFFPGLTSVVSTILCYKYHGCIQPIDGIIIGLNNKDVVRMMCSGAYVRGVHGRGWAARGRDLYT